MNTAKPRIPSPRTAGIFQNEYQCTELVAEIKKRLCSGLSFLAAKRKIRIWQRLLINNKYVASRWTILFLNKKLKRKQLMKIRYNLSTDRVLHEIKKASKFWVSVFLGSVEGVSMFRNRANFRKFVTIQLDGNLGRKHPQCRLRVRMLAGKLIYLNYTYSNEVTVVMTFLDGSVHE